MILIFMESFNFGIFTEFSLFPLNTTSGFCLPAVGTVPRTDSAILQLERGGGHPQTVTCVATDDHIMPEIITEFYNNFKILHNTSY